MAGNYSLKGNEMGGRIYATINGHKYEVIFGSYVIKFINVQTGKLKATTPLNTPVRELKNYL